MIGGINLTIYVEILDETKETKHEDEDAFFRLGKQTDESRKNNEIFFIIESLLNYNNVLESKVQKLNDENERLNTCIEQKNKEIEILQKNDAVKTYEQLLKKWQP